MMPKLSIPQPILPKFIPGYRLPETTENLLSWTFVVELMSSSSYYWISTINQKMQPHSVPVWGIWYENRLHVEGSRKTAWARNAIHNPHISVHPPDAEKVVLIEGNAQFLADEDLDSATWEIIDTAYQTKYKVLKGSPWIVIHPRKVMAWDNPNLKTMTCWVFE